MFSQRPDVSFAVDAEKEGSMVLLELLDHVGSGREWSTKSEYQPGFAVSIFLHRLLLIIH